MNCSPWPTCICSRSTGASPISSCRRSSAACWRAAVRIVAAADPGSELFDVLTDVALLTPTGDDAALAAAIEQAAARDLSDCVESGLRLAEI